MPTFNLSTNLLFNDDKIEDLKSIDLNALVKKFLKGKKLKKRKKNLQPQNILSQPKQKKQRVKR